MKKRKIFIDTDMGNDDIMAICMLLMQKNTEIVGCSTVIGVSTEDYGYQNLRNIFSFLERDIPVQLGYTKALVEKVAQFPPRDIERANNLSLLQSLNIPKKSFSQKQIPIEQFIYENVTRKKTTILALGPLTNIAATIKDYGENFIKAVAGIVMMGGGITRGNVPPYNYAEYNIWLDPEAANVVFSSGIPITMVGIDATACIPATKEFKEIIQSNNPSTKEGKIIKGIIINNDNDFCQFYDPLAAYILLDPSTTKTSIIGTMCVPFSGKQQGQTLFTESRNGNVTVVMEVFTEEFYKTILELVNI